MCTMHITIPALQKRPKVLPMCLSEMLCTGTQSSGGQEVRMCVYASIIARGLLVVSESSAALR